MKKLVKDKFMRASQEILLIHIAEYYKETKVHLLKAEAQL